LSCEWGDENDLNHPFRIINDVTLIDM